MAVSRFGGKTALVTGAASGIGRATALLLAREGASVVAADRDEAGLNETVRLASESGGDARAEALDVTSEAAWEKAIARVLSDRARLDVVVNCAGIAFVRPVADMTLDEWRRVMAVNLDGVFLGTRAAVRAMRGAGGGSVVNVSSASGIKAAPASSAYCASKAAVILFSKSVALECASDGSGVRVNVVAPGGVKTPMWERTAGAAAMMDSDAWKAPPLAPIGKRFAEPEEIARAIAFLASSDASYVTGSVLAVDAGYTA